jgi:lysophospholipase L1-like esterase
MHKPFQSLAIAAIIFLNLGLACYFVPEKGINIGSYASLNFPSLNSLFGEHKERKDISGIIAAANQADTSIIVLETDSPAEDTLSKQLIRKDTTTKKLITSLQYANKACLQTFFESISSLKNSGGSIRVLHYGDSQIEGDRITDYLRLKLQGQFGGSGPGLISLMPIAPSVTNKVTWGAGWDRYAVYGGKDKRVTHSNFGVMAAYARFCGYRKITDTAKTFASDINITTTKFGGQNAMNYKKIKLFYGGSQTKTWCEFYDGPALSGADSLDAGGAFRIKEFKTGLGSLTHLFKFSGKDSPDFYGMSLEGDNGVMVDNIALRGSSGTFYHQINFAQMKQFYDYLNVKLIILQFGGNALPMIKDETMAKNYAGYLKGQINIIKRLAPQASIIFIGPADMSVKEGTEYVTHPYLEVTRDAIKKVVLESGAAFFDMYDCMGGSNSMASWVDEKLAATDYIHFSPQGARKIATLFYSALINEYNTYVKTKK